MVHQVTRFSDAFSAWENWNLTNFDSKSECLLVKTHSLCPEPGAKDEACPTAHHGVTQTWLLAHLKSS